MKIADLDVCCVSIVELDGSVVDSVVDVDISVVVEERVDFTVLRVDVTGVAVDVTVPVILVLGEVLAVGHAVSVVLDVGGLVDMVDAKDCRSN